MVEKRCEYHSFKRHMCRFLEKQLLKNANESIINNEGIRKVDLPATTSIETPACPLQQQAGYYYNPLFFVAFAAHNRAFAYRQMTTFAVCMECLPQGRRITRSFITVAIGTA